MADCIITMKSRTLAEKARRAIEGDNIRAYVVSVDPTLTKRGCSVGIEVSCRDVGQVRRILDKRQIPYGDVMGGGV